MQASSLQFSDNPGQQKRDISDLFLHGEAYPIKTGTEAGLDAAGRNKNREYLEEFAGKYNHIFHVVRSNWIAIDRDIIKRGSVDKGQVFVVSNDELDGHMQDRVMCTVEFDHVDDRVGRIAQGAAHYPTRGARPGDPNHQANVTYAKKIEEWLRDAAKGSAIGFVNGDFNMNDKKLDWSFGRDFTSMADELKAWQNTGHGPIDGFCSYDRDGRVKAKRFNVMNDSEFFQFSDHYVCRGVWDVRHLKTA